MCGGLCEAKEHINIDIINDIGRNVQLGLHCKDKNTDFGPQSLVYKQHYGFRSDEIHGMFAILRVLSFIIANVLLHQ
ncbi:unnamed protein product [Eruca vesicaria subsp. sativa]|uniref:Uncharacterized protein n=1 Tax=Eruca vesicaria subsp. sativa TaxID=29727 RepID=A0ABC8IW53_ERUVS|nr:unnamed protein product [Eruca vesicaria subsp. sativa]